MDDSVTLPRSAVICAARHFVAAHESYCTGGTVDFGAVCAACPLLENCLTGSTVWWTKTAAPVFDAAGLYPNMFR